MMDNSFSQSVGATAQDRPPDAAIADAIVARLDRLRATRHHVIWVGVLGAAYLIETFDNTIFGYLAPSIRQQWGLSLGDVGVLVSAVFYGMIVGAIVGGRLVDRVGRKPVLIWASVFYGVASLLCALAPNMWVLFGGRVLTGLGIQAATGAILVYASEMFPRLSRGRFMATLIFLGALGAPITAFTAAAIAPSGASAWRTMFMLGGTGLLIAVPIALFLPKTVRWLASNRQADKATTVVEQLEALDLRKGPLAEVKPVAAPPRQGAYRELFKPVYAKRLGVVSLTFAAVMFSQYGFAAYLPTVLIGSGLDQAAALQASSIITLGAILVTPLLWLITDRIERKTAIFLATLLAGIGMVSFGNSVGITVLIVTGLITYMGLSGLVTSFYSFIPEVFPTEVRGVGTGFANGVGRASGIASGLGVAALYAVMGLHLFWLFTIHGVVGV